MVLMNFTKSFKATNVSRVDMLVADIQNPNLHQDTVCAFHNTQQLC
jgi:hypothetical protein